jgi:CubicO group peptidase (beta-lactamase class C family)
MQLSRYGLMLFPFATVLLVGCATDSASVSAPSNLHAALARAVDRYRVCGAVVAVVKDRKLDAVEASGGCESLDPPRPDSVFQAASLSKPVFAYAVLKLVEQGKLALDTPVVTYLPDGYRRRFDPFGMQSNSTTEQVNDARLASVTVRMALNHTSGLPNWSPGPIRFTTAPGATWQYSGEAYVLLQRALEAVTGSSLDRYMTEQVFKPLGMNNSSFIWEDRFERAIVPGSWSNGAPTSSRRFNVPVAAATLYTTAQDYGRFLAAVLGDERLLALITEFPVPVESRLDLSWGNGWGIERVGSDAYLWQWGNNPGYRAFVMASPRTGSGFVLLTNSESGLALSEPIANAVLPGAHRVFKFRMLRDGFSYFLCDTLSACF